MIVRAASFEDAPTVAQFNASLAEETEGISLDRARLEAGVRAALEDPAKGRYFIAEDGGKIAGQLMITYEWSDWRNGFIWWIQSVYVPAASRNRGVFRALYEAGEREARAHGGVRGIRLYVESHNTRAQQVYERMGMKRAPYQVFELDFVIERP